ncbi:MAG: hypothetical protein IKR23_01370 [Lachnospiraceae bacterium]|nr:hypothetical protein [Lachnospiraceae bacterium]
MKQLITFTRLELINIFGINVRRYVKDPAAKKRYAVLTAAYVILALVFGGYLCGGAYGLAVLGAGEYIPMLYPLISSLLIFVLGAFRAKAVFYREKDIEMLSALPAGSLPIAVSRFIRTYAENAAINALILLPALMICGIYGNYGAAFYINLLIALIVVPILPTALMAWAGIVITAIIARNRHKVLTEVVLMLVIVTLSFMLPFFVGSGNSDFSSQGADLSKLSSEEARQVMSEQIAGAAHGIEASVPFIRTWGSFYNGSNFPGLLIYALISLGVSFLSVAIIGHNFFAISAALFPVSVHHEFKMGTMQQSNLLSALINKEAKRYFSSGVYVSNTIVGPVMALIFSVALGFFDPQELIKGAGGLPVDINVSAGLPFIIGMIFAMMTIAASSVSMEGKNIWILKSLPVSFTDMMNAKLLFNLIVIAPFYAVSEIVLLFTVHATLIGRLWLILAPAAMIVFSVTFGLFMNLKFPKFDWENAMEVVKQSAATGLSMLALFAALLPGIALMLIPEVYKDIVCLISIVLISIAALLLYKKILTQRV